MSTDTKTNKYVIDMMAGLIMGPSNLIEDFIKAHNENVQPDAPILVACYPKAILEHDFLKSLGAFMNIDSKLRWRFYIHRRLHDRVFRKNISQIPPKYKIILQLESPLTNRYHLALCTKFQTERRYIEETKRPHLFMERKSQNYPPKYYNSYTLNLSFSSKRLPFETKRQCLLRAIYKDIGIGQDMQHLLNSGYQRQLRNICKIDIPSYDKFYDGIKCIYLIIPKYTKFIANAPGGNPTINIIDFIKSIAC